MEKHTLKDLYAIIEQKDAQITEKDSIIEKLQSTIIEKDGEIEEKDKTILAQVEKIDDFIREKTKRSIEKGVSKKEYGRIKIMQKKHYWKEL
jgi:uncharacterized protein (DUF3084 family)